MTDDLNVLISEREETPSRPRGIPERLHEFFERACDRTPDAIALECGTVGLSYRALDDRANRLARLLRGRGVGPGSRVGILVPRSVEMYVALLGAAKSGAAFVPIDPAAPADRVSYIADDAGIDVLLAPTGTVSAIAGLTCPVIDPHELDAEEAESPARPVLQAPADETCYVIYTSGSTGRPKGVEVAQESICNFIDVVGEVYDVRSTDRVYQGMTIAFDFSIEEIWPTWAAGATLVAGPTGGDRIGSGLTRFLDERRISVLYCVPTVLATVDHDLPHLRALLVGGEACPAELVQRWSTPGRRMLNTYGPTEATVTATWCELRPGRRVTIGKALPTYRIVVLDDDLRPVPDGAVGEICIGGVGVARGYLNRPELNRERFLDDLAVTGGGRLYRTGDLGRVLEDGEIEYLGRADSEVKIRGHRIDLQEIESILLQDPAVTGAAVAPHPDAPTEDLVAHLALAPGSDDDAVLTRLHDALRRRLSSYMVPAFVELLDALPLMASGKVDRGRLPKPSGGRFSGTTGAVVAAGTDGERAVAQVWSGLLGIPADEISVEADFFADLGGHSLLAARAVSALRERGIAPTVSVADVYAHPTIRSLAAEFAGREHGAVEERPVAREGGGSRAACGLAQLGVIAAVLLVLAAPAVAVFALRGGVLTADTVWSEVAVAPLTYLLGRFLIPVIGVRALSGGLEPGEHPLWGATYLRVWTIRFLLTLSPLGTMSGSPVMAWYLRLLGAEVGADCQLQTQTIGLPSMVRIGARVAVGYGAHVQTFRVRDGRLELRPVVLADGAFVGANSVVEPGAEIGRGAGLAAMSVASSGQRIPDGEFRSGSPSEASAVDPLVAEMRSHASRPATPSVNVAYAAAWLCVELLPILLLAPAVALGSWAYLTHGPGAGLLACLVTGPLFVVTACAGIAAAKLVVLRSTPPGIHSAASAFGVRKWFVDRLLQLSLASTNALYATLYTPYWLRALGARIGPRSEVSTAANLDPDLLTLGAESFVADMAAVGAATHCNGRIAVARTTVGRRSFVGNAAFLRSGTTVGDGCLVGVHTDAPGPDVPSGTSWLGSPAIDLPRRQDSGNFDDELIFHPTRWRVVERFVIEFFRAVLPGTLLALAGYAMMLLSLSLIRSEGAAALLIAAPGIALAGGLAVVLVVAAIKWAVVGRYRPRVEPLWSRFVRRTEFVTAMYETAAVPALLGFLTGTPMLPPMLRLFGARVGRRCWIDTTFMTEFDLVRLGDDCSVGTGTSLQTHLFEDRVMKMSRLDVRTGSSIGARTIVLYDSMVGDRVSVEAMSLVMKGEHLPPGTAWQGIPAQAIRSAVTTAR